jgi:hypothetical protein
MKDFFGTSRNPSSNDAEPSQTRRKLLMSCAYLPAAPLLAMLGGCDSSSTDVLTPTFEDAVTAPPAQPPVAPATQALNIPLPPYKTTDVVPQQSVAELSPVTVQVTHVPEQKALPPAKPTKMNVGIYSLQYNAFTQVSTRREVPVGTPGSVAVKTTSANPAFLWDRTKDLTEVKNYEGIETYIKRALNNRFALVYRAMVTAFAKHSPTKFDISFFTAPEFFWNVPFGDFATEAELQVSAKLCLDIVTSSVRTLISKFPADKYGNIVMLPGTIAVLKADPDIRKSDGTLAGADGVVYDATNHVVCTHNLPLNDANYPRPAYMVWPKRNVSWIDYIDEANGKNCTKGSIVLKPNPIHPELRNPVHKCIISLKSNLSVSIATVSSAVVQSFDANGKSLSDKFQNDIVEGLPFGIDICLDYAAASVLKDTYRMAQLDEREFILNFQLAAGMGLDLTRYATVPFMQYAIYNEGYRGKTGATAVWKLNWTEGVGRRLGTMSYEDLAPLDADSPTDIVKGIVAIDQTDSFVAPDGSDSTDIPKILDAMNPGLVRVWAIEVDASYNATGSQGLLASKMLRNNVVESNKIHFIE